MVSFLPVFVAMTFFFSASDVLERGLRYVNNGDALKNKSEVYRNEEFHSLFGSSPLDLASQWYDGTHDAIHCWNLSYKEITRGFKSFMMAHYWLWTYPKNATITASHLKVHKTRTKGKYLWVWIKRIADLSSKVIYWPEELDCPSAQVFIASTDGVDFRTWEQKKHPTLPIDTELCSWKYKHAALKYQIAIAVHTPQCIHIFGPCRGGEDDKTMLKNSGLLDKVKNGKLVIMDGGYKGIKAGAENKKKVSVPNPYDSKEVHNFKSRVRLRQETFNGRIKHFRALQDTFRHDPSKHQMVFTAVVVTVQYQMNNGSPIYIA